MILAVQGAALTQAEMRAPTMLKELACICIEYEAYVGQMSNLLRMTVDFASVNFLIP